MFSTHKHNAFDSYATTSSSKSSADLESFFGFGEDNPATRISPPSSGSTTPDISSTTNDIGYKVTFLLPLEVYQGASESVSTELEEESKQHHAHKIDYLLMQRQIEEADKSLAAAEKNLAAAEKNSTTLKESLKRLCTQLNEEARGLNRRIRAEAGIQ